MKIVNQLEFDKIVSHIHSFCQSIPSKEIEVYPLLDRCKIEKKLSFIFELQRYLKNDGRENFVNIENILPFITSKEVYDYSQFLLFFNLIKKANQITKDFSSKQKREEYPFFSKIVKKIYPLFELEKRFCEIFSFEGIIKDSASKKLFKIRKRVVSTKNHIKGILKKILQKYSNHDVIITIRDGRYVIPVKGGKNIDGIVHSKSSSGSTFYIEPTVIISYNNKLKLLENEEKSEIFKIFLDYTSIIKERKNEIVSNYKKIIQLDFDFATAEFSNKLNSIPPEILDKPILKFVEAKHPLLYLLKKSRTIPFNLFLDKNIKTVVISGPNTGGKSVLLKSIGLLTFMALSGIPIPVKQGTKIGIFKKIYADINDLSSISEGLSTFSNHVERLKTVVESGDKNSLVLIDELGSSTDPIQGAALGCSLIEFMHKKRMKLILTTHLNDIKYFASTQNECLNASMAFDPIKNKPIFKLNIGFPGQSYGIKTAEYLGLDKNIIKRANSLLDSKEVRVADMITSLAKQKNEISKKKEKLLLLEQKLNQTKKKYQRELFNIKEEKKQILKTHRLKALELLKLTQIKMKNTLNELKQNKRIQIDNKIRKIGEKIRGIEKKINPLNLQKVTRFVVGETLFSSEFNANGRVLQIMDNRVKLEINGMNIITKKNRLFKPQIESSKNEIFTKSPPRKNPEKQLNVIGKYFEDSLPLILKFIDDATLSNQNSIRIIHGKGTGVLREKIRNYLKQNNFIYTDAPKNDGGTGVTVVEI